MVEEAKDKKVHKFSINNFLLIIALVSIILVIVFLLIIKLNTNQKYYDLDKPIFNIIWILIIIFISNTIIIIGNLLKKIIQSKLIKENKENTKAKWIMRYTMALIFLFFILPIILMRASMLVKMIFPPIQPV